MIETLKLVKEAVARRDLIPLQTCYHIYDGRIQAFNGSLTIDAPAPFFNDVNITINADKLFRAAKMCRGEFKYKATANGKLSISKNKFRALIPLQEHEDFPRMSRDSGISVPGAGLARVLQELRPFVSEDASRVWSRSILFADNYAYATNNIVMAKLPTLSDLNVAMPVSAIDALLNLDIEPETLYVGEQSITFDLPHGVWMRVNLLDAQWPDVSKIVVENEVEDLPPYFAETIENILPFCDDPKFPIIKLGEFGVSTSEGATEATVDIGDFPDCKFRAEPLLMVAEKAYGIAFSAYPGPCYFEGSNGLCGVLVGIKQ